ncbi:hypothetical protein Q0G01_11315, partial [Lactiplantibacillus plantarum]|nr:hypothetical protein [Lactiplantibacillus plantarum]MDN3215384.1 hypothetical protein [Lactiplantibacillus plantarum]MDN3218449.1 hypothetical protein [Lactiplantibacillus plantarum]MDO1574444.1 hypothetical protein [Lactiplantibacillus plantarum]
ERFNRNLRYFYPKGTCFEHISAQDLTTTLLEINQRPLRTCLKSGQFDMIVQKRMITYELPQQSLTAPI